MLIRFQQWRASVGRVNASWSPRSSVTEQQRIKSTSRDIFLLNVTASLETILLTGRGRRGTGQRDSTVNVSPFSKCARVLKGRNGGGETSRELSPSLLIAPWRTQLLMLAGDVESNPGPYTNYGQLKVSDLELVVEELRTVEKKWRLTGKALTTGWSVDDIMYPHTTDCLREVLRRRLQYSITYWVDIVGALREVNESQLANHLDDKYCRVLPEVTQQPESQSVSTGAETIFTVEARGSKVTFQWQKNGENLNNDSNYSGADTNTLSIQHVKKSDGGYYRCRVENEVKKRAVSKEAKLTVFDPPEVTQHPKSQLVPTGAETKFKVEATENDLTFQWQKNGSDVHNDSNYSGTDTNMLWIRHTRKSDEGRYRCRVRNEVNMKFSDEAHLTVSCLNDSVEVIDITSYTYSRLAQDIERKKYGYKMHFPADALPPEVDECQVHVESSLCGQFQLPENMELISGVYWITINQEFAKPVTVEFQHCAIPEHIENLTFIVTKRTVGDLPYKFCILDGGRFSLGTDYGKISLSHFCGVAIASQSPRRPSTIQGICCRSHQLESDVRTYRARVWYSRSGCRKWAIYFTIMQDLTLYITATTNTISSVSAANLQVGPDQLVVFAGDEITLDIAGDGVTLENGWRITPLTHPAITKNQVNNFDPGCKQPFYCQLHVEWTKEEEQPMELLHRVNLLGARTPFNFFVIQLPQLHLQPIGGFVTDEQAAELSTCKKLNLMNLLNFPGKKENIKIPQKIGTKYLEFGILLLNDETGAEVRTIVTKHHEAADQINLEILSLWIQGKGKPLSWSVLINVLKSIELPILAKDIENGLAFL